MVNIYSISILLAGVEMEDVMKDFELCISPVEDYIAPEIPKLGENHSDLLKKIPSRWQKNAKIIAGLGLVGIFALSSGCGVADSENGHRHMQGSSIRELRPNNIEHDLWYTHRSYSGYSEANMSIRLHTGGGGSSGYMVHLTEHEAFAIIRTRLEAAGLVFGATPPEEAKLVFPEPQIGDSDDNTGWFLRRDYGDVELDLFDVQKGVGLVNVRWLGSSRSFMPSERELARRIEELFVERVDGIIVGAFYNPGMSAGGSEWSDNTGWWVPIRPSNDEAEESRPILVGQLIRQADMFVARLQSEGILEQFPIINVTINGTSFNADDYPIIINNQKMVPALELFEALEMEILVEENSARIAITGTKNDVEVRTQVGIERNDRAGWASVIRDGWISVTRNGNRERLSLEEIPVIMHDGIMLAPLQFVAGAAGATIEWNEDTRTITITQD